MTKCPGCNATLPDGAQRCQFCGRTLGPPSVRLGPRPAGRSADTMPGAPAWVKPVYNLIAIYWVLNGAWGILSDTALAGKDGPNLVGAAFGALGALIGLGLLLRIEAVRGVVNFVCALQILFGLLDVLSAFLLGWVLGLILAIVQIATAGLMIFLIGETETRAPNL
ncbi:MAG: zinc ribbon domain-containing protein [Chthonomonadales bacterium]|nr:zinc ribbon domain-containing protein [Chthonomonadales bacterium]